MVERVCQIAKACIEKLKDIPCTSERKVEECHTKLKVDDFLSNIFYFRACNYTEQIAVINFMDKFIEEHDKVKT
jgi:RAD51-like protein 2